MKDYTAVVWQPDDNESPGKHPGNRLTLVAADLAAARASVVAEYGEDAIISVWSEEDGERPRGTG
jgi:hypothetical protein